MKEFSQKSIYLFLKVTFKPPNTPKMNVDKLFCKQATSSIDEIMTYEIISSNVRIVDVYERTI